MQNLKNGFPRNLGKGRSKKTTFSTTRGGLISMCVWDLVHLDWIYNIERFTVPHDVGVYISSTPFSKVMMARGE